MIQWQEALAISVFQETDVEGGSINIIGYIFARFATKIYIKWVIGFCFKYSTSTRPCPRYHASFALFRRNTFFSWNQNILLETKTKLCGGLSPHVFAKVLSHRMKPKHFLWWWYLLALMLYPTLSLLIRYISALLLGLDIRGSLALFIFTLRENISFISSNVLRRHLPPLDKELCRNLAPLTDNFDAQNKNGVTPS